MDIPLYFRYWGKAKKDNEQDSPVYHLLVYHCLDVAAVAEVWWRKSPSIRRAFTSITKLDEERAKAWVLFFVALHDYGKFDVRFQSKAIQVWKNINPELSQLNARINEHQIKTYHHGSAGLYWFYQDNAERFKPDDIFEDTEDWDAWFPWVSAVVGHHGGVPDISEAIDDGKFSLPPLGDQGLNEKISKARKEWLVLLEDFFLKPVGLSLDDNPPLLVSPNESVQINIYANTMLAGFCSICDWLGSSEYFQYKEHDLSSVDEVKLWYENRLELAKEAIADSGIVVASKPGADIQKLLGEYSPRQVQLLVKQLAQEQSLIIMEASTGSGKTEAALAQAWHLLESSQAESIIFALPTQATANAMLKRLEEAAPLIFEHNTNIVLAHGRAKYQQDFIDLKSACKPKTPQEKEEALVQCGMWLAQSRKRVFLGQVGVCTVDQVLVSVLPIKHKFVRGFGIGRSVLIIDEVHAYDTYMYGLLSAVLKQQRLAGGSAILLSATLPYFQKAALINAWGGCLEESNTHYPLVTQCVGKNTKTFDLSLMPEFQPEQSRVIVALEESENILPSEALKKRILQSVKNGAQVCVVCNLVDVAQNLYREFSLVFEKDKDLSLAQLLLFHSRFVFKDRQDKEDAVKNLFGKSEESKENRKQGHLLIATQVVEQSLDIDFDWMITQLCPVDLLFQRFGRLHRHHDNQRPCGFENPKCTILVPDSLDYQLHALIYGNSRVLWRTHECLKDACEQQNGVLRFPKLYRQWIESVYQEDAWENEPSLIQESFDKYQQECSGAWYTAKIISEKSFSFEDSDSNIACLTRDGEMGLSILPYYLNAQGEEALLDGSLVAQLEDDEKYEKFNINSVCVPPSWNRDKKFNEYERDGIFWLKMDSRDKELKTSFGKHNYRYSDAMGLQRVEIKEG